MKKFHLWLLKGCFLHIRFWLVSSNCFFRLKRKMKINCYIKGIGVGLTSIACMTMWFKSVYGFGNVVILLLLIIEFFFVGSLLNDLVNFSLSIRNFIRFLIGFISNFIFRVASINFFISGFQILNNLETCTYDLVLKAVAGFFSLSFLYWSNLISLNYGKNAFEENKLFFCFVITLSILSIVFLLLFFIFGAFKLALLSKYALVIMYVLIVLFFSSIRLFIGDIVNVRIKIKKK